MAAKVMKEFLMINKRSGKALQVDSVENGSLVLQEEPQNNKNQIWILKKDENGTRIIHKASGKALDLILGVTESGTNLHIWEESDVPTQLWRITGGVSRKVANLAASKVLDIADISDTSGAYAQIWEDVGGENQRWRFLSSEEFENPSSKKQKKQKSSLKSG
ncbi:RICIN domain-containing protein [Scatolibacter rhodanostii]|uniref:RICIN domain-containing protein n=1 Tax=Scatolibacter rhodanostii TaxID=2014781 RepID=UPI000C07CF57|nr:RICIN domain-containing protein [Scatolibacter rhodanostii]